MSLFYRTESQAAVRVSTTFYWLVQLLDCLLACTEIITLILYMTMHAYRHRQTDTHRQTDRQTDTHTHTHVRTHLLCAVWQVKVCLSVMVTNGVEPDVFSLLHFTSTF